MQKEKSILTTGDVAELCQVNFRTVIRWIKRGDLKAYQLPGRGDNRIQPTELITFLKANNMPIPESLADKNQRILIVDDDPAMLRAMSRLFKAQGYDVFTADNGFNAGILTVELKPRLVVLDLQMPGLNGFEVLKHIRTSPLLENIAV